MRTLSRAEFARHLGVNRSSVTRWVQDGRITLDHQGRIDPEAAQRSLAATGSPLPHHMARQEQIDEQRADGGVAGGATVNNGPATGPEESQGAASVGLQLKMARVKREVAQAAISEMERDQLAKTLVLRTDVEFVLDDFGRTLANLLDRLADRYTPDIAAHAGDSSRIHSTLVEAARDLRSELEHHMARKTGELL